VIKLGCSDSPPECRINTNFKYELGYKDDGDGDSVAATDTNNRK
jgi:hypothetical protein